MVYLSYKNKGVNMKLKEAEAKIKPLCGITFGELFSDIEPEMAVINKGKVGQMLELALGKKLDSGTLDFEDGELKTNKCDKTGKPKETVFITQIASIIDDLIIYKLQDKKYLIIVNASRIDEDLNWMVRNKLGFNVNIVNESHNYSLLAVQGPKAVALINKMGVTDLPPFFSIKRAELFNINLWISRTGYTGCYVRS